jgi:ArsR family transcriptional regulator
MNRKLMARRFAALSSDVRLRIVELISAHKEMCVCELVDQLGMSQANISRHVGILRDAGILQDRKVGTWVLLRVDASALDGAFGELSALVGANHRRSAKEDVEARLAERCETGAAA